MAKNDPPMWRAVVPSYIEHSLQAEGAEFTFTPPEGGQVAENLWPLNDAAQALVDAQSDPHAAKTPKPADKPARRGKDKAVEAAPMDGAPVEPEEDDSVA